MSESAALVLLALMHLRQLFSSRRRALLWLAGGILGSLLGGASTGLYGYRAAFVFNALSFVVSAWCIARLRLPAGADARASMMAAIEMLDVTPAETPARVIINSRTGTVVINSAVRLSLPWDQAF